LQDAKARFSELVDRALTEGPQEVTRHGRDEVVVVEKLKYDELAKNLSVKPKMSLGRFLLTIPKGGPDDLFDRPEATGHDIEF